MRVDRRWWFVVVLALITGACRTVCDEVADEAEASGCAVGVLPGTGGGDSEAPSCEDDREKRATCLLDNSENVCALSDAEQKAVADCYAAEGIK